MSPSQSQLSNSEIGLKEYFESKLCGLERAIETARVGMEKRLDGMNEFRDVLKDQNARSPSREEVERRIDVVEANMCASVEAVEKDIKELMKFKNQMEGVASQKDVSSARGIAFAGLAIALFNLISKLVGL